MSLSDLEARFGDWIRARVRKVFPGDFEDVVQDVMLKLVQALPAMKDDRIEPVRAFISRTLRSVIIDEWRKRAARPRPSAADGLEVEDAHAAEPSAAAEAGEAGAALARALDELPERERAILRLRFRDGLGFREIAEVLDVPQGSVAGWYSRALGALREKLR